MMKNRALGVFILLVLFLSGCVYPERKEYKVQLTAKGGEFWAKEYGWKSDETEKEKIQKDFDGLVAPHTGDKDDEEASQQGIYILDRKIYLKDGKINTELHGLITWHALEKVVGLRLSHGERIFVEPIWKGARVQCNGKVLTTENNAVLIWPESAKTLMVSIVYEDILKNDNNLLMLYKAWEKK